MRRIYELRHLVLRRRLVESRRGRQQPDEMANPRCVPRLHGVEADSGGDDRPGVEPRRLPLQKRRVASSNATAVFRNADSSDVTLP